jgi:hypothetical protein
MLFWVWRDKGAGGIGSGNRGGGARAMPARDCDDSTVTEPFLKSLRLVLDAVLGMAMEPPNEFVGTGN